jgi:hypothetical protein
LANFARIWNYHIAYAPLLAKSEPGFQVADDAESRAMTLKKAHLRHVERIAKIFSVGDPPVIRTALVVEPKQTLAPDCDQFLSDRMALDLVILSCSIF